MHDSVILMGVSGYALTSFGQFLRAMILLLLHMGKNEAHAAVECEVLVVDS